MGFFDKIQKRGHTALKHGSTSSHTETRVEKATRINPHFSKRAVLKNGPSESLNGASARLHATVVERERPRSKGPKSPTRRKRASATPSRQVWGSDDDEEEEALDGEIGDVRKRKKLGDENYSDPARTIPDASLFESNEPLDNMIINGAEIANLQATHAYHPAFAAGSQPQSILLHYPSRCVSEKFELLLPSSVEEFNPLDDIRETIETVIANYLPPSITQELDDDSKGIVRRLKRSLQQQDANEYDRVILEWNDLMERYRNDQTFLSTMQSWRNISLELCERIMTQAYSRTVSLEVNDLRKYKNGEDNVYGELLPKFIRTILRDDTALKSDQTFVDLGSGVGNVVLQAALEVGCNSWGCEIMPSACRLARAQKKEFEARCKLWGISIGNIHLEEGNFLQNERIRNVLSDADVILINNQAFTPKLNEDLINMFLDLKNGARIVSLRSFAPIGQKNQARNAGAIYNILDVKEKTYYDKCVSWTNAPGTYYISTKDSRRLETIQ